MVGSHSYYKFSRNLILTLKAQEIEFLPEVRSIDLGELSFARWKKEETLGLEGELKEEWKN